MARTMREGKNILFLLRTSLVHQDLPKVFSSMACPTTELSVSASTAASVSDPLLLSRKHLVSLLFKHASCHSATRQLHSHIITSGLLLCSTVSYMVLFNVLIRCYPLYKRLQYIPSLPPSFETFVYAFLLHSSADLESVIPGLQLHSVTLKMGFESHVYIQTALIRAYAAVGFVHEALQVFYDMPERNSVSWNVIITGLTKCGELERAHALFNQMPARTVVSWTLIVDGYVRLNRFQEAMALFQKMAAHEGVEPNEISLLTILPAISALQNCQSIHGYAEKRGYTVSDIRVSNSLIDSYAKCGCIQSAIHFFEEMSPDRKNVVSWTSMISGLAMHGMGREAMENFRRMEKDGVKPNRVTLLSIIGGCSHGGLVEEGLAVFKRIVGEHQVEPDIKHYGCLIDMLGRAGRLEEAEKVALDMPLEVANVVIWRTLLGACSFHCNVEMAERVTVKILEMEKRYGGDYVLLSNIFAGAKRYGDAEKMRRLKDDMNAYKTAGHSLV